MRRFVDLIFRALSPYTSPLLIHSLGNRVFVRLVNQRSREMEEVFYSRGGIMGSGVRILPKKIRLAVTAMVVEQ